MLTDIWLVPDDPMRRRGARTEYSRDADGRWWSRRYDWRIVPGQAWRGPMPVCLGPWTLMGNLASVTDKEPPLGSYLSRSKARLPKNHLANIGLAT